MTALLLPGILAAVWLALVITGRRRVPMPPPPLLLPAVLAPCGCLWVGGVLLAACAGDDPGEPPVEQWAAEIGEDL